MENMILESAIMNNRSQVAQSLEKERPDKIKDIGNRMIKAAVFYEDGTSKEHFVCAAVQSMARFIGNVENRNRPILFCNRESADALFEVQNNSIGLCVKESEIISYATEIQCELDRLDMFC